MVEFSNHTRPSYWQCFIHCGSGLPQVRIQCPCQLEDAKDSRLGVCRQAKHYPRALSMGTTANKGYPTCWSGTDLRFKLGKLELPLQIRAKFVPMLSMSSSLWPLAPIQDRGHFENPQQVEVLDLQDATHLTRSDSVWLGFWKSHQAAMPGPFDPPEAPSAGARPGRCALLRQICARSWQIGESTVELRIGPKRAPLTECHKWPWHPSNWRFSWIFWNFF